MPLHETAVLNVVGLTPSLIGEHTPNLRRFRENGFAARLREPAPAVTCTSQSTMLTGLSPQEHGIVGNGWYFRDLAEVGFWKQSNALVRGEKVYEALKRRHPEFTCAKLFWWYNMYAGVDFSVTPRPHYPADGRKVFDVYTEPLALHDPLVQDLGPFPFFSFWGPASGIASSEWIAASAKWTAERHAPTLQLVYLPHLDYDLQRFGPQGASIPQALRAIDAVVGDLIGFFEKRGARVMIVSEYGISAVRRALHPNRLLRRAGYLAVRPSLTWEMLDCGGSRAFAVSDHQICHVYVRDPADRKAVAALFEKEGGHRGIYVGEERAAIGLDHERAGDIVLLAQPDAWYTYYFWDDDAKAPDFARTVDIHRKPGYDPVELFIDPRLPLAKGRMAWRLLQKKLGFRYTMDVIGLDASLVKGSHGTPAVDDAESPVFLARDPLLKPEADAIPMGQVRALIEKSVTGDGALRS